ncbi:MAG: hypothetical protein MK207_12935 [Saprospiraceae bacterium]|nr:hypothetical protein [Saprospiraceae bacterium]
MSVAFILLVVLGFAILIISLVGMLMPSSWMFEKAELIHASPAQLFPFINSLEKWSEWTVWAQTKIVSELDFEYKDKKEGIGAVQIWKSNKMNGVLTITQSDLDKEVKYQFDISEGNLNLLGTIVLDQADSEYTQIAWRCKLKKLNDFNPIRRFQAYFLKNYFDTTIEGSILSLKEMFECQQ